MHAALGKLGADELALARRFDAACAGHSNRTLSAVLGVTHETVRNYRRGRTAVPAIAIARLVDALNISPQWLLFGTAPLQRGACQKDLAADGLVSSTAVVVGSHCDVKLRGEIEGKLQSPRMAAGS